MKVDFPSLKDRVLGATRSPTFSMMSVMASASMFSTILGGVGGLLQARWISPETMGEFTKYGILTGYFAFLLILVQDGLMRQYPYLIGKGDIDEANAVASTAKAWYLISTAIAVSVFAFLSIRSAFDRNWISTVGWGGQMVVVLQQIYGSYLGTMYRRSMEFKRLSYNGLIMSVVCFALLIFVKLFGFWGMVTRQIAQGIIRTALDAHYLPVKIRARWDSRRFISLAKISVPLSVVGYLRTSFLTSTFSYFVLRYCGKEDLGLYGIALSLDGFAQTFLMSIWQVFNVKMTSRYGQDDSITGTVKSLVAPTIFALAISIVCAAILCVCVGPFVRLCIPKYIGSISIVYVLAFGMIFTALRLPTEVLRTALQYEKIYLIAIVRFATVVGAMLLGPKTIIWFAACSLFGGLVDVVFGYVFLYIEMRKERYAVQY